MSDLKPCLDHGLRGDRQGYGDCWRNGRKERSHRAAYCESKNISIASIRGLVVLHTCDNPRCIEPDHLVLGTQGDNMRDMSKKRRTPRLKLTNDQVLEIRATCKPNARPGHMPRNPYSYNALGKKYGVNMSAVRDAFLGRTFKELK